MLNCEIHINRFQFRKVDCSIKVDAKFIRSCRKTLDNESRPTLDGLEDADKKKKYTGIYQVISKKHINQNDVLDKLETSTGKLYKENRKLNE